MAQRQAVLADFKENTMNLKKSLAGAAILLALTTTIFAKAKKTDKNNGKLKVVTTIFPEYDWTREILGDNLKNVELTLLIGNGVDLHSYQPSIQDIAKISTADVFIYVGGESDGWVKDALKNATNKNMKVINLMETLGDKVKAEEVKEGMQAEEEEEHDHHHHHEAEEEHHHHHEKKAVSEDRTLADYEGEWQSVFPYMSENFKSKTASYMAAAEGFDNNDEAWNFFYEGNKTDIRYVNIKKDKVTFINNNGSKVTGTYKYDGFYSDCWGETSIRYQFKNTDKKSKAPAYIQFDDHLNFPTKAEHFHIYCGNDAKAMLDIKYNWPTYYPKSIDSESEMIHEFLKHYIDEDEDEDEHEHHHHHHHDDEDEVEYDEHVWLSIRNAKILSAEITSALCEKDSANAAMYKANLTAYSAKLDALDAKYAAVVKAGSKKTVLFGDRFPFRYLVDDYGLDYFAAFVGCSAETEASFETVIFLAKKVDELGLNTVLKIEGGDGKIARTIVQNTKKKNAKVLTLDSIQSTTSKQAAAGTTYLKIMEANLPVLAEALK